MLTEMLLEMVFVVFCFGGCNRFLFAAFDPGANASTGATQEGHFTRAEAQEIGQDWCFLTKNSFRLSHVLRSIL